jgi:putative hydrolase of the HAD superfamily
MNIAPKLPAPAVPLSAKRGFTHVDTWVFDLDNTLYPFGSPLWPQIDERISLYLVELFGLDGLSSRALQKYYYQRYGTTLKGLMDEHDVDAAHFLAFAHDIDRSSLLPHPELGAEIARLPGRKLIMTNGSVGHAEATAQKLGILEHFEGIFDIVAAGFVPKPDRRAYDAFYDKHGIDPARSAMFEDLSKNLVVPHSLGMTTVLIVPGPDGIDGREDWERDQPREHYIDHVTDDIAGFLSRITPP